MILLGEIRCSSRLRVNGGEGGNGSKDTETPNILSTRQNINEYPVPQKKGVPHELEASIQLGFLRKS